MNKPIKLVLTLVFAVALVLSLGVCAYADSAEIPVEKVGYGYGYPDAASVEMHGLDADDISIDGIKIDLRSEDGKVFIRVTDLAAAKLLRDSADKAASLGLDYSKLCISDGIIHVIDEGLTDAEKAELEAKLAEITKSAQIKVSEGDRFELSSAGEVKLIVEIGGFVLPSAAEQPIHENTDYTGGLDVDGYEYPINTKDFFEGTYKAFDANPVNTKPTVSTIYISYEGFSRTYQDESWAEPNNYSDEYTNKKYYSRSLKEGATSDTEQLHFYRSSYAFLAKAYGDEADYFIKITFDDEQENDSGYAKMESVSDKLDGNYDPSAEGSNAFSLTKDVENSGENDSVAREEAQPTKKLASKITIASDAEGQNVIKTINISEGVGDSITSASFDTYTHEAEVNGAKYEANTTQTGGGADEYPFLNPEDNVQVEPGKPGESVASADIVDVTVWDMVCVSDTE